MILYDVMFVAIHNYDDDNLYVIIQIPSLKKYCQYKYNTQHIIS